MSIGLTLLRFLEGADLEKDAGRAKTIVTGAVKAGKKVVKRTKKVVKRTKKGAGKAKKSVAGTPKNAPKRNPKNTQIWEGGPSPDGPMTPTDYMRSIGAKTYGEPIAPPNRIQRARQEGQALINQTKENARRAETAERNKYELARIKAEGEGRVKKIKAKSERNIAGIRRGETWYNYPLRKWDQLRANSAVNKETAAREAKEAAEKAAEEEAKAKRAWILPTAAATGGLALAGGAYAIGRSGRKKRDYIPPGY